MNNNVYLHGGAEIDIFSQDIIGIFDIEKTTVVKSVNDYLAKAQKKGDIFYISLDMPKSFIVADSKIYVSNVSTETLKKRAKLN